MRVIHFLTCTLFLTLCVACGKDDTQRQIDAMLIEDYLTQRGLEAQSTASGLHYIIDDPGNGEHPDVSHKIHITYVGRLLNGFQFDASNGVVMFELAGLIKGWQEGIPLFGKGGSGTLIIPSHLGYGSTPRTGIPANSILVFDIELVDFE
ncbi:MAG: FKBP-type peptidyl-prolyl cis-trans isomerase [Saprospiraceae bacterium]|nr:FKBP-type peptidyl-prolyl cis-trans isomerase [Saprospiraceae bacterium]